MTKLFEQEKKGEQIPRVVDIERELKARMRAAEDADAESRRKGAAYSRKANEIESKLPGEKALLERMKADWLKLKAESAAKKKAEDTEIEKRLHDKVIAGEIGVVEYHETIIDHRAKVKNEAEATDAEIMSAEKAIREKAMSVYRLEMELWDAKANCAYMSAYPSEMGLEEMKKMIQEMSYRSQVLATQYRAASIELERVKEKIDRAYGRFLSAGWNMDNLSLEQLKTLPLLPEIPEKYLPTLAAMIREVEAEEMKRLEAGQQPGIYYMSCSYLFGLSNPWQWLCRNSNSPNIQMSRSVDASGAAGVVNMSNLPKKTGAV